MDIAVIIPARYGSTRLPGKPLAEIAGKTLIRRVVDIASRAQGISRVVVATDDKRIHDHVTQFGGEAVMTPETCRNGTERVLAATLEMKPAPDAIINFQGDAVLTPPWILEALALALESDHFVTPAVRLSAERAREMFSAKAAGDAGGTTVVTGKTGHALYFSKSVIPFVRGDMPDPSPVFQHIGMYGYHMNTLQKYAALPEGPLEAAEKLEQLRALENGIPIRVVEVDYRGRTAWAVDSPGDIATVEKLIENEGEIT